MAGDWIKLRLDLRTDPAVFKLASITKLDRFAVVGRLAEFWGWVDKHAVDGVVDGASSTVVDDVVSFVGFAEALVAVDWLRLHDDGIEIPRHERHNSESAKERGLKNARQARWRANKDAIPSNVDALPSTKASTREEKRREEKNTVTPTQAPEGFDNFWNEYPNTHRKQAKGKCLEVWKKAKAESEAVVILGHIAQLKASPDWTKNNGEFIPAPLVYLNNRRWEGVGDTQHESGIMAGAI